MLIDDILHALINMDQIERLKREHPGCNVEECPDGSILIFPVIKKKRKPGSESQTPEYINGSDNHELRGDI